MDFITQSPGPLPSVGSSRSHRRLSNSYNSGHILAYLCKDSVQSTKSISSHEPYKGDKRTPLRSTSATQPSPNEVWWHDLAEPKPIISRPSPELDVAFGPGRSQFRTTPGRRRPPALKLDGISNKPRGIGNPATAPSTPECPAGECGPALRSPWDILKDFPSPPSTPTVIRGSKTSISISRILRRGGNNPDVPTPTPEPPKYWKDFARQQDENMPPALRSKKKRHASFGSLGKAFKATPVPVPQAPLPALWSNSDHSSNKGRPEPKGLNDLHRRDTFKSKLFSITTSPKADTRDGIARFPSSLTQAGGHRIPHREARAASCTGGMAMTQGHTMRHKHCSRSEIQPAQSANHGSKKETENLGPNSAECIMPGGAENSNPSIAPTSRARSSSYLNVLGLPWRQVGPSPTRTSPILGGATSAPTTPVNAAFERSSEAMHLPASTSAQSLRAEVDTFGTEKLASFFRSEYSQSQHIAAAANQDTIDFYQAIGAGAVVPKGKNRKSRSRQGKGRRIPEIVVSSSTGLVDLRKKWNWVLD